MGTSIFWLVVLVGFYFLIKKTDFIRFFLPPIAKAAFKSRTTEQKRVIRYFYLTGFLSHGEMSDVEYDALIKNYLDKTNFKKKAFDKFGLDEDEVTEVSPIKLENYFFNGDKTLWKVGKDGKERSSAYQVSWLFASSDKFYLYSHTFYLDADTKKEISEELFWKDIGKFSTASETVEVLKVKKVSSNGQPVYEKRNIETNLFTMSVPGDKIECVTDGSDTTERSLKGLRTKLDEKKKV